MSVSTNIRNTFYDGSLGSVELPEDLQTLKKHWKNHPKSNKYVYVFKYVKNKNYGSPVKTGHPLVYGIGTTVSLPREECEDDISQNCARGINVATLWWVLRNSGAARGKIDEHYVIIRLKLAIKDIVCIPTNTDGKFRVCKVEVID
ncbi:MAG TPA: hypothetical protein VNX68_10915 [Nitrosopumilaceae archaeon]|nr:hypothetical protein [Nitrosopumilaceae archaeon]